MPVSRRDLLRCAPALACLVPATSGIQAAGGEKTRLLTRVRSLIEGKSVTLKTLVPAGSETNLHPIAEAFGRETGVEIELISVPVDDINSRLILAAATGRPIDVALPATFGIPDLAESGALLPLDDYRSALEADQPDDRSLFWLGDYYNDRLYGYQTDGDVYLMFYNRQLLKKSHIAREYRNTFGEAPKPAKTWAELDRMLSFFHRPHEDLFGGALFRTPDYIAWEFWIRLHAKGVLPFDDEMRPQLGRRRSIAAARELFRASDSLTHNAGSADLFTNWRTFSKGNVLCSIGWGGSQKYFRSNGTGFESGLVVAPTPGDEFDFSYFNWGWNYAVPATSRHPELGFLFCRYAVMPEPSVAAVRAPDGFFDPYQAIHYEDAEISRIYGDEFLRVHRKSMRQSIPDLYVRGRNQYMSILSDYLLRANNQEIAPQTALTTVSELWDDLTDSLGRAEQVRQWRLLLRRYPASFRRIIV